MKRIILDTSVYGKLIEETRVTEILAKKIPSEFVVYGSEIIRKELRETPKHERFAGRKKRILLLNLYSTFIRKDHHELKQNKLIETLAKDYYTEYRKAGGSISGKKMKNDLLIIAIATIHQLDIIVSDDERTMFSISAVKAYAKVNRAYGLKDPVFKTYRRFASELQEDFPL